MEKFFRRIHLELNSICNLKCPFCGRQTKPDYKRMNKFLSKKALNNLLTDEIVEKLEYITVCGNYGEPTMVSSSIFYLIEKVNNRCGIWVSTNGSTHNKAWWNILGRSVKNKNVEFCFCLDGLTDETNKYRGTSVEKVMSHMDAYINGGGKAGWKVVLFEHNQHEIEEIKKIAKDKNITMYIKHSWQFNDDFKRSTIDLKEAREVHNSRCSFLYERMFYVSALGEVLPCCYIVNDFYQYPHLLLEDHTIDEILNSTPFKSLYLHANKRPDCRKHCDES